MNVNDYFEKRQQFEQSKPKFRDLCVSCLQPAFGCYCKHIERFDSHMEFVILIHPIEVRRRIATGRMSYLCLENSHLIVGEDYSNHERVNELINDPNFHSVILYPGVQSVNLSPLSVSERKAAFPTGKKLRIFVIDGTWAKAKTMVRKSLNLQALPKVCFTPDKPSQFRVRKQPNEHCFSTIEAIHQLIELVGESIGFDVSQRKHDGLLYVFEKMVQRQLDFIKEVDANPEKVHYRRFVRTSSKINS
jgi:Uncharacterized conserved protein